MKIFTFSFKSLLLAAGLMLGSANAWADATLVYGRAVTADLPNGYTAWSSSDVAASGTNVWIGDFGYNETYGLHASGTGNRSSVMTFNHTANSLQTFDIVFDNLGNTGNASNYSYLRIGSAIEIQSNQQNQNGAVIINGVSTAISDCNVKNYNRGGDKWTIHVEINTLEKKVTALTIEGTPGTYKGDTKYAHYTLASETSLGSSPTFNSVTIGFIRAGGTPAAALTSIKIQEEAQAVTDADYTINYQLNSETVKTVEGTDAVGATITADVAVDGEGTYAGNHYLITAADAPSMTLVDGENILNVPVRSPYTATLNVTTTVGTNDPVLVTTPLTETDAKVCNWSYAYPMYVLNGGVYYKADNTATFGEGGEFTNGQVINKSVTYSNIDESIVFFREAENKAGTTYSYSNGNSGNVGAQNARDRGISVGKSLEAGVYEFVANITAANRRSLVIRQSTNDPLAGVGTSNEDLTTGVKSATFTLLSSTDNLYINGANSGDVKTNQSEDFDYVLIRKVCPVEITAAGYATYSNAESALDLANLPDGLTAYYVASDGVGADYVKLTTASGAVEANTGLLFQGTPSTTYYVPVAASGSPLSGNRLIATDGNDVAKGNYVFAFEKLNPTTTAGFYPLGAATHIDAGKAYLNTGVLSKVLRIGDGEASEVVAPEVVETEEPEILFNMAGVQVDKNFKGFVVNQKGEKRFNR